MKVLATDGRARFGNKDLHSVVVSSLQATRRDVFDSAMGRRVCVIVPDSLRNTKTELAVQHLEQCSVRHETVNNTVKNAGHRQHPIR